MKFRHLLVASGLTTLAAAALLTVVPQTAEAKGPPTYTCYSTCSVTYHPAARKIARELCEGTSHVTHCVNDKSQRVVCYGSGIACPSM